MLLLSVSLLSEAGDTIRYTLEQCHEMAIENGPSSRSREELLKAAELNRKAALAAMSPHVSAIVTLYVEGTDGDICLLNFLEVELVVFLHIFILLDDRRGELH